MLRVASDAVFGGCNQVQMTSFLQTKIRAVYSLSCKGSPLVASSLFPWLPTALSVPGDEAPARAHRQAACRAFGGHLAHGAVHQFSCTDSVMC